MVTVVTSVACSGTSLVMHGLVSGGAAAVYTPDGTVWLKDGTLVRTPGFYDCPADATRSSFPLECAGQLVKLPWQIVLRLPRGQYRVLLVTRDPLAIAASMDRFAVDWGSDRIAVEAYGPLVKALTDRLSARPDMTVRSVAYEQIVLAPAALLIGWTPDPLKAASAITAARASYRLES